eukprot:2609927-Pyramimonas_sp.AAC.1
MRSREGYGFNIVEAEAWGMEQHTLSSESACLRLTDFCSASPSLVIPWMLHVIARMNLAPAIVTFFTLLCQDSAVAVLFGGRTFSEFSVRSGVKQGCPISMMLFALAADPLLRWLMYKRALHIDRAFAYADDFCFGLCNAVSSLGPLFATTGRFEKKWSPTQLSEASAA